MKDKLVRDVISDLRHYKDSIQDESYISIMDTVYVMEEAIANLSAVLDTIDVPIDKMYIIGVPCKSYDKEYFIQKEVIKAANVNEAIQQYQDKYGCENVRAIGEVVNGTHTTYY